MWALMPPRLSFPPSSEPTLACVLIRAAVRTARLAAIQFANSHILGYLPEAMESENTVALVSSDSSLELAEDVANLTGAMNSVRNESWAETDTKVAIGFSVVSTISFE
jgi:hypothetical protein